MSSLRNSRFSIGDAFFVGTCLFSIGLAGKLTTAALRPGKRPTGRDIAAMVGRVLRLIRQTWAHTNIVRAVMGASPILS